MAATTTHAMKIYVANNARLKEAGTRTNGSFPELPNDHTKTTGKKKEKKSSTLTVMSITSHMH